MANTLKIFIVAGSTLTLAACATTGGGLNTDSCMRANTSSFLGIASSGETVADDACFAAQGAQLISMMTLPDGQPDPRGQAAAIEMYLSFSPAYQEAFGEMLARRGGDIGAIEQSIFTPVTAVVNEARENGLDNVSPVTISAMLTAYDSYGSPTAARPSYLQMEFNARLVAAGYEGGVEQVREMANTTCWVRRYNEAGQPVLQCPAGVVPGPRTIRGASVRPPS